MHLNATPNQYQDTLGAMFDKCPKAVVAAIAVSSLTSGGSYLENAQRRFLLEWWTQSVQFRVVREADPRRSGALSSPQAAAEFIRASGFLPDDAKEHFGILMLNAQNGFVAHHAVSTGTLSASLVSPKEVFGPAMRMMGVASIIIFHNHPSGDPTPSREDLRLTTQIVTVGKLLDIRVHDHLILGDGTDAHVSLAARGQMEGR